MEDVNQLKRNNAALGKTVSDQAIQIANQSITINLLNAQLQEAQTELAAALAAKESKIAGLPKAVEK